jgi:hypothetical protein
VPRGAPLAEPAATIGQAPPAAPHPPSSMLRPGDTPPRPSTPPQAELAPAALLNFHVAAAERFDAPFLAPHLLAAAQPLTDEALPRGTGGIVPQAPARLPSEPRAVPKWAPQLK